MIFGKKLVSVPFAPYGGVCADDGMVEKMLIEEAIRITRGLVRITWGFNLFMVNLR